MSFLALPMWIREQVLSYLLWFNFFSWEDFPRERKKARVKSVLQISFFLFVFFSPSPQALDAKVIIFKKKRRKNYRRTKGHRQVCLEIPCLNIHNVFVVVH